MEKVKDSLSSMETMDGTHLEFQIYLGDRLQLLISVSALITSYKKISTVAGAGHGNADNNFKLKVQEMKATMGEEHVPHPMKESLIKFEISDMRKTSDFRAIVSYICKVPASSLSMGIAPFQYSMLEKDMGELIRKAEK